MVAVPFPRTRWHRLLGGLLEALLAPVDISVETEVRVLAEPPRADILLLRRGAGKAGEAQRERLADGLRDTAASHLLLELKYREGIGEEAFVQLLGYDHFYRRHRGLKRSAVASFLVSSRTPQSDLLARPGYRVGNAPGVYATDCPLAAPIRVILLNELAPLPHNAPLKCFASRREEQRRSFEVLRGSRLLKGSLTLERLVYGLWRLMMKTVPEIDELTPEYVMQVGAEWIDALLDAVPPEELRKHLTVEERLAGLTEEEIRRYLKSMGKSHQPNFPGAEAPPRHRVLAALPPLDTNLRPAVPATVHFASERRPGWKRWEIGQAFGQRQAPLESLRLSL
jgi:hypothetical protein